MSSTLKVKRNYGAEIGARNYARVVEYFQNNLCATQKECGNALGLSHCAISRYVRRIRIERRRKR